MQTIRVHDKAVVLVLNKQEAKALSKRLKKNTGIIKTKPLINAEAKLEAELDYIMSQE